MSRAIRAFIFTDENKVFLIKRTKNKDNVYWVVPGGGVESGEDDETALKREILEELGISIKDITLFCEDPEKDVNQGFFLCKEDKSIPRVKRHGPEIERENPNNIYEIFEVTIEDIKSIPLLPKTIKELFLSKFGK